jgi:hypothetical protein
VPCLNLALLLVARVTRPLVSDALVSNSASIHSLNVLAGMSGFARDRRSLLLASSFVWCLPSFSVLLSAQTQQQAPEAPAAGAKSRPERVKAKATAGKPAKPGAVKAKPGAAAPKAPPAPKDGDEGIAITWGFRDIIADKTPSACPPSSKSVTFEGDKPTNVQWHQRPRSCYATFCLCVAARERRLSYDF